MNLGILLRAHVEYPYYMVDEGDIKKPDPELRKLYPNLSDEELLEAEENLKGYLEVVLRIYERIRSDPEEYARFKKLVAERKLQKPDQE